METITNFFSNLLPNAFKSSNLDENLTDFQKRINLIVSDLILPYTQPTNLNKEDRFRDLLTLLDPSKCNNIAITMSDNLEENYTKLQLEQFANDILVGRKLNNTSRS